MCTKCAKKMGIGKRPSINNMKKYSVNSKNIVQRGLAAGGGILAGKYIIPKVTEMIDKEGKLNPSIVNVATAAVGYIGATKTKGLLSDMFVGLMAGAVVDLAGGYIGINGGYANEYSAYSYNGNGYSQPSTGASATV